MFRESVGQRILKAMPLLLNLIRMDPETFY